MGVDDTQTYSQVSMADTGYHPDQVQTFCPERRSRSVILMLREWWFEFLSWFVGTCALAAIFGLLFHYRDKSVESWDSTSGFLRLATVVAALSQVSQTALMVSVSSSIGQLKWPFLRKESRSSAEISSFDAAARGASGSALLLWRLVTSGRFPWASIGAIVSILILFFSPFAQQSLTIELRTVDSLRDSVIAKRVVKYDATASDSGVWEEDLLDKSMGSAWYDRERAVAAMLGWVQNYQSPSNVSVSCPTDYCTWPEYTTLGVCAYTEDVSSALTIGGDEDTLSIPGVEWGRNTTASGPTALMTSTYPGGRYVGDMNATQSLADLYFIYFPVCNATQQMYGDEYPKGLRDARNWKAFKASLQPCLHRVKTTFNLSTSTNIISTQRDLTWRLGDNQHNDRAVHCYTDNTTKEEYCLNTETLMVVLSRMFKGEASLIPGGDSYTDGEYTPIILNDVLGRNLTKCVPGSSPGFKGFQSRMQNIAVSTTNSMIASSRGVPVIGTAWATEQYFHVQSQFLSLPGAVWLFATLFFLVTFAKSRNAKTPIWKSSPLVLLDASNKYNTMDRVVHVEERSEHDKLRLEYTGQNWYLEKKN